MSDFISLPIINCPETKEEFINLLNKYNDHVYSIVNYTPKACKMILDNFNTSNRPFKNGSKLKIKSALKNNAFDPNNGSFISFNVNKILTDGQNRLAGALELNQSITLPTKLNNDLKSIYTIDAGIKRSLHDNITLVSKIENKPENSMSKEENQVLRAFIEGYKPQSKLNYNDYTQEQISILWNKYKMYIRFGINCFGIAIKKESGLATSVQKAVMAKAAYLGLDRAKIKEFCHELCNYNTSTPNILFNILYKKIAVSKKKPGSQNTPEKYRIIATGLNCYLINKTINNIKEFNKLSKKDNWQDLYSINNI